MSARDHPYIPVTCPRCNGTGRDPDPDPNFFDPQDCRDCENNRRVWVPISEATDDQLRARLDELTAIANRSTKNLEDTKAQLDDLWRERASRRVESQSVADQGTESPFDHGLYKAAMETWKLGPESDEAEVQGYEYFQIGVETAARIAATRKPVPDDEELMAIFDYAIEATPLAKITNEPFLPGIRAIRKAILASQNTDAGEVGADDSASTA